MGRGGGSGGTAGGTAVAQLPCGSSMLKIIDRGSRHLDVSGVEKYRWLEAWRAKVASSRGCIVDKIVR